MSNLVENRSKHFKSELPTARDVIGERSTWSECSETCGLGYKYSSLNALFKPQQEAKRRLPCTNIKCPVDGNWSNWTTNESCSNSLCICSIRLERYCNKPVPADGGLDCHVNGGWTQWSSWSLCSQPCQDGIKNRYRSCANPVPKYGGLLCNGSNTDELTCYSDKWKNFGFKMPHPGVKRYKVKCKVKNCSHSLFDNDYRMTHNRIYHLDYIRNHKSDTL
nr:semaphorin-5A-like [Hydra vulgaris]